MLKQKSIVLSASPYSFEDEKTKEQREGTTVRYLLTEDFTPFEDKVNNVKGYEPAKATLLLDDYHKFQAVPGLYEVELGYKVDSQGKASLQPISFELISQIQLKSALKINPNQNPA